MTLNLKSMPQSLLHLLCTLPRVHHCVIMPHKDRKGEIKKEGEMEMGEGVQHWLQREREWVRERSRVFIKKVLLTLSPPPPNLLAIVNPSVSEFNNHKTGAHRVGERECFPSPAHYHWTAKIKWLFFSSATCWLGLRCPGARVCRGQSRGATRDSGWPRAGLKA